MIIGADNGPDEACVTIGVQQGILWLQRKYNFDAIYYRNSAPKSSAFNRVEREMAHLSLEIVGKMFAHDHYGSHLKNNEVTNDDLCLNNFGYGGNLLAKQWDGNIVDGHIVHAEYVPPLSNEEYEIIKSEFAVDRSILYKFYQDHGQLNNYLVQIKNCLNVDCVYCKRNYYKSKINIYFPPILCPPPIFVEWNSNNLKLKCKDNVTEKDHFLDLNIQMTLPLDLSNIPFDYYNAEFKEKDWNTVKCPFCVAKYFPSHAAMLRHRRALHFNQRTPKDNDIDIDVLIQKIELKEQESINKIVLENKSKYLCQMKDNTLVWKCLDKNHGKVKEYEHFLQTQIQPPTKDGLSLVTNKNWLPFFEMPYEFIGDPQVQDLEIKENTSSTASSNITSNSASTVTCNSLSTLSEISTNIAQTNTPIATPTIALTHTPTVSSNVTSNISQSISTNITPTVPSNFTPSISLPAIPTNITSGGMTQIPVIHTMPDFHTPGHNSDMSSVSDIVRVAKSPVNQNGAGNMYGILNGMPLLY